MILYPMTGNSFNAAAGTIVLIGFCFGVIHPGNFTLLADKCGLEVLQKALGLLFLVMAVPMVFFIQIPGKLPTYVPGADFNHYGITHCQLFVIILFMKLFIN